MKDEPISTAGVIGAIIKASRDKAGDFGELDGHAGDGDLGVTIRLVMDALEMEQEKLAAMAPADCVRSATRLIGTQGASTFGTFVRIAGRSAAQPLESCKDWSHVTSKTLADVLESSFLAIQERGGAQLGDKTLLDALGPAYMAARASGDSGAPVGKVLRHCAIAAQSGAESTANLISRAGRSAWMAERGKGFIDPGAAVIATWLQALADALSSRAHN